MRKEEEKNSLKLQNFCYFLFTTPSFPLLPPYFVAICFALFLFAVCFVSLPLCLSLSVCLCRTVSICFVSFSFCAFKFICKFSNLYFTSFYCNIQSHLHSYRAISLALPSPPLMYLNLYLSQQQATCCQRGQGRRQGREGSTESVAFSYAMPSSAAAASDSSSPSSSFSVSSG